MRSESWTFIWQPNVSIRYLGAIVSSRARGSRPLGPPATFAFRPFAFAPRVSGLRAGGPGALLQHLTSGAPKSVGNRLTAEHARELLDPRVGPEPPDNGRRPPAIDAFVDLDVRVGAGGNLRQVRDAEHLKRRAEGLQL